MSELTDKHREQDQPEQTENPMIRKRWFGRGIYGSKDVPIRLLDGLIAFAIIATIALIIYSAVNGGFQVSFDTDGGSAVETQVLRYGDTVAEPEAPTKPGYEFAGWKVADTGTGWNFALDTVSGSLTLVAQWTPAQIIVKLDPDGGTLPAGTEAELSVTYGEQYGPLPVPEREGYTFAGWVYSGSEITADSTVQTNGEHVLTASWVSE